MLLEFSVENFLSIKDRLTLSMEAAAISDFPDNTFSVGKTSLLKSAVIYGANSSGKSNVLSAMGVMEYLIRSSGKMASTDTFDLTPFLLSEETKDAPSLFEILFFIQGERYRYGFEVSQEKVHTEWLFRTKIRGEKMLFVRDGEAIEISKQFPEGEKLEPKTRSNALFLSVVDQFNGEISNRIVRWFAQFNPVSGIEHHLFRVLTAKMLNDSRYHEAIVEFISYLDLGFEELEVHEREYDSSNLPENRAKELQTEADKVLTERKELKFLTYHTVYDSKGNRSSHRIFDMDKQESSGTNKLFDLIGPIFFTFVYGGVLVIDELNTKLHPLLTKAIVGLFNSSENNPLNAQLIFATHDTNLLSYGNFRRDQIYFTEKNQWGATDLYSLLEYKEDGETIRKDRSFEKDYIQGRYGAIPYLGNLSELFATWQERLKSTTQS